MGINFLLVIIIVISVLVLRDMRHSAVNVNKVQLRLRRERTPRYKWLMAGGALLLLTYIGYVTIRDAGAMNSERSIETLTVKVPTQTVELPTAQSNPDDARQYVESDRILCTLLFYDRQPVHAETVEINWPEEDSFSRTINLKGSQISLTIRISKTYYQTINDRKQFMALAEIYCNHRRGWISGGFSGQFQINQYPNLGSIPETPFSLSLANFNKQWIKLMLLIVPAVSNDPLKEIAITELIDNPEALPGQNLAIKESYGVQVNPQADIGKETGIFFIDFVARFTVPFLLLCFMMPLLVAPFRNKAFAVAVIMTLGVFYFVALDRMVLNIHIRSMQNPSTSFEGQMQAMINCTDTFFYRNLAAKTIQAVIDRTDKPEKLKQLGERSVEALYTGRIVNYGIHVDMDESTQEG